MLSFLNEYMIKKRFGVDILRTLHEHVKDHIHHHTYKQLRLTNTSYRITRLPPIEAEHWVTDAFNGSHVGNGNSPIDVVFVDSSNKRIGIDVKCLTSNNTKLAKSTSTTQCSLITIANKKQKCSVNTELQSKFDTIKNKFKIEELYYMFLISSESEIGFAVANVAFDQISIRKKCKSNNIDGLIESNQGISKLDSSQKKLQLKLNPKNIPIITLWGPDEEILNKLTFKPLVLELDEDFLESLNKTIDFSEIKFA